MPDRISVRLGEHQITTNPDCRTKDGKYTCAPPVEDIGVEQVFIYERFSNIYNDIALVKLARDVEFKSKCPLGILFTKQFLIIFSTGSIKPICLPINETLQQETNNITSFTVTGWGATEKVSHSDIPMEVMLPKQEPRQCRLLYRKQIRSSQLCAGEMRKDSCNGDSGGPLGTISYYRELQRFVQYGIVSFGSINCGDGVPAVYTRVANFIPWISHIIATK